MKSLFIKYRAVIKFITTFLLVYICLSFCYKLYLDYSKGHEPFPDYITHLVAEQSQSLLQSLNYKTDIVPHTEEPSIKLIVRETYVARVVEGCNAVSVIILFVAFMMAFASRWKPTLVFTLAGSVLIYAINLIRISVLSLGLYHYPEERELLHNIIFPLLIYGLVLLLWMIWINRFSKTTSKDG